MMCIDWWFKGQVECKAWSGVVDSWWNEAGELVSTDVHDNRYVIMGRTARKDQWSVDTSLSTVSREKKIDHMYYAQYFGP